MGSDGDSEPGSAPSGEIPTAGADGSVVTTTNAIIATIATTPARHAHQRRLPNDGASGIRSAGGPTGGTP